MTQFRPLDPAFSIDRQLTVLAAPVVLVNLFTVEAADVDALLKAWEHDALWMKRQTGFISTQLHRAVGDSCMFLNYAVWESVEHFRQALCIRNSGAISAIIPPAQSSHLTSSRG